MTVSCISSIAMSSLSSEIGKVLRNAAALSVLPLFGRLDSEDVEEKSHGNWVTVADTQAEAIISAGLSALCQT